MDGPQALNVNKAAIAATPKLCRTLRPLKQLFGALWSDPNEWRKQGQGLFTHFLTEALAGSGDFDGDGKVVTPVGTSHESANACLIQPDGKIVAAGDAYLSGTRFGLVRYLSSGALDSSFGTGGKVTTAFSSTVAADATDLALQPDGKIILGGLSYSSQGNQPAISLAMARGLVPAARASLRERLEA